MDTINELVKLKSLKDSGIITESEFNELKNKLLNNQNVQTEPEVVLNTENTSEQGQSHSYFEESMSSSKNKIADKGNPSIFSKIGPIIGFIVLLFGVMIIWENVTKGKSSTWEMIMGGERKKNNTSKDMDPNSLKSYGDLIEYVTQDAKDWCSKVNDDKKIINETKRASALTYDDEMIYDFKLSTIPAIIRNNDFPDSYIKPARDAFENSLKSCGYTFELYHK